MSSFVFAVLEDRSDSAVGSCSRVLASTRRVVRVLFSSAYEQTCCTVLEFLRALFFADAFAEGVGTDETMMPQLAWCCIFVTVTVSIH